jgi:hypothetical protein
MIARGLGDSTLFEENEAFATIIWDKLWDAFEGLTFTSPPMPATVESTVGGQAIPAVPTSGQAASDTVQAITNAQMASTQQQNADFFQSLDTPEPTTGLPWWEVILIGVGGIVAIGVLVGGKGK